MTVENTKRTIQLSIDKEQIRKEIYAESACIALLSPADGRPPVITDDNRALVYVYIEKRLWNLCHHWWCLSMQRDSAFLKERKSSYCPCWWTALARRSLMWCAEWWKTRFPQPCSAIVTKAGGSCRPRCLSVVTVLRHAFADCFPATADVGVPLGYRVSW